MKQFNNKGMTLVELVIALAVVSISMLTLSMGLTSAYKVFVDTTSYDENMNKQKNELNKLEYGDSLDNAVTVTVLDSERSNKTIQINGQFAIQSAKENKDEIGLVMFKPSGGSSSEGDNTGNTTDSVVEEIEKADPDVGVEGGGEPEDEHFIENTIDDQIFYIGPYRNRGYFDKDNSIGGNKVALKKYDCIYVAGNWWMFMVDETKPIASGNIPPSGNAHLKWKKISSTYDSISAYEKGDIVVHEGIFYQCQKDIVYGIKDDYSLNSSYWTQVDPTDKNITDNVLHRPISNDSKSTIAQRLDNVYGKNEEGKYIKLENVDVYQKSIEYNLLKTTEAWNGNQIYLRNIRKVTKNCLDENGQPSKYKYVEYYLKINDLQVEPGQTIGDQLGWQKLSCNHDSNSAYFKGDIVYDRSSGSLYQALQDITTVNSLSDTKLWKKLK